MGKPPVHLAGCQNAVNGKENTGSTARVLCGLSTAEDPVGDGVEAVVCRGNELLECRVIPPLRRSDQICRQRPPRPVREHTPR